MEDLIFRYLDGECTVSEIQEVEHLLSTDSEFATLFSELEEANQLLFTTALDEPPTNFTNKVMKQITPQFVPWKQGMLLPKVLLGFLVTAVAIFAMNNTPNLQDTINLPTNDFLNSNALLYGAGLALFFLALEWFLNKKDFSKEG